MGQGCSCSVPHPHPPALAATACARMCLLGVGVGEPGTFLQLPLFLVGAVSRGWGPPLFLAFRQSVEYVGCFLAQRM